MCRRTTLQLGPIRQPSPEVHPRPFPPLCHLALAGSEPPFPPLSRRPTRKTQRSSRKPGKLSLRNYSPPLGWGQGQARPRDSRNGLASFFVFFRPHLRPPVDRGESGVVTALGPMTMQSGAGPPFCRCGSPSRTASIAGFFPADLNYSHHHS